MKNLKNKMSGSYYTPVKTVKFMKDYLLHERREYNSVLEPSAGDGRFIDELCVNKEFGRMVAVELGKEKAHDLQGRSYPDAVQIINDDFLKFAEECKEKYSLIIGNPPYINLKNMERESLKRAKAFCRRFGLAESLVQNIWVGFLLASVSLLQVGGSIFFVLPIEFLQVQYAERVRVFLEQQFNTIHICLFDEKMFPDIEQESCLVYLTDRLNALPHIQIDVYRQLDSRKPYYSSTIERNKPLKKWTNAILADRDIDLLHLLNRRYVSVSQICEASPGIVTGGNHEFIISKQLLQELGCEEMVLPTIAKSSMVRGDFFVTCDVIERLAQAGQSVYLLNLADADQSCFSEELKLYLDEIGNKENSSGIKLKDRYKCRNRKPWYGVPIVRNGQLFFFKRYDKLPRVCVNTDDVYTTDIAYNMRLREGYDPASVAFCFYNSLTLAQCEYYGRYYAGGVLELIPSEFKELTIPYREIARHDIEKLAEMFKQGESIDAIVDFVNARTIASDLDLIEIEQLDSIRNKLMGRRI